MGGRIRRSGWTRRDRGLYVPPDVRRKVLEEEGRCRICGSDVGLEIHHINPFTVIEDRGLRRNMCVLCRLCHRAVSLIQRRFPDIYMRFIAPHLYGANEAFRLYVEEAKRMAARYRDDAR